MVQLRLADAALRIAPDKLISAIACLVAARCRLAEGRTKAAVGACSAAHDRAGRRPTGWNTG